MAGQSVGLVHDIAPAADILRRVVAEAEAPLAATGITTRGNSHAAPGRSRRALGR